MSRYQPKVGRNLVNQRHGTPNANGGAPAQLRCSVCGALKTKDNYANRQLTKFTPYNKSYQRDPGSVKVTCKTCTAGQTTELTCCVCDTVKGLDGFAKAQRKDPDNARCLDCVGRDLKTEPDIPPPASDDEDDDEDEWEEDKAKPTAPSRSARSDPSSAMFSGSATPASTFVSNKDLLTEAFADCSLSPLSRENDGWSHIKPAGTGGNSRSYASTEARTFSPTGYGTPTSHRSPSVVSSKKSKWGAPLPQGNPSVEDDPWANYGKTTTNQGKNKTTTHFYDSDDD